MLRFEHRRNDFKSFALFHATISLGRWTEQILLILKLWTESEVTNKTNANDNPGKWEECMRPQGCDLRRKNAASRSFCGVLQERSSAAGPRWGLRSLVFQHICNGNSKAARELSPHLGVPKYFHYWRTCWNTCIEKHISSSQHRKRPLHFIPAHQ